jgi:uncharacterized membrane protein (DUF485 family)
MTDVAHPSTATRSPAPTVAFGGIIRAPREDQENQRPDFAAIHASAEFQALRRVFRRFVVPVSALFFLWYLTYVLLAAYARGFMSHRVFGSVNVALLLGLLQFVSTIAITDAYRRYARKRIDPRVRRIRARAGVADR